MRVLYWYLTELTWRRPSTHQIFRAHPLMDASSVEQGGQKKRTNCPPQFDYIRISELDLPGFMTRDIPRHLSRYRLHPSYLDSYLGYYFPKASR